MRIGHNTISVIPAVVIIIMSLLALFAWPYAYYIFMKFAVFGVSVYYAYYLYLAKGFGNFWFWLFVVAGILFNPFMPVYLDRAMWSFFDIILVIMFGAFWATHRD